MGLHSCQWSAADGNILYRRLGLRGICHVGHRPHVVRGGFTGYERWLTYREARVAVEGYPEDPVHILHIRESRGNGGRIGQGISL